MSAQPCAACDRLRVAFIARRRIELTFTELKSANEALLTAASGLSVALMQGMAKPGDVYELLRIVHLRFQDVIADAERAALHQDGAA